MSYGYSVRLTLIAVYVLLVVEAFFFAAFFAVAPEVKDILELSTFEIGVSLTGLGIAMALVALPAGFLIDRFGPRRLTLIGGLVLLLSAVGHAVAIDVWSLLGARMLLGAAATIILPGGYTWLRNIVSVERRSTALTAVMPIIGIGSILGPIVAGAFADALGVRAAFWVIAAMSAGGFLLVLVTPKAAGERSIPVARLRVILSLFRREALVLGGGVVIVIATFGDTVVNFLVPIQMDDQSVSATMIGLYLTVGAILFVVVGTLVTRFADRAVTLAVSGVSALLLGALLVPLVGSDQIGVLASVLILRFGVLGVLWTIAFPLGGLGAGRAGLPSGAVFGMFMAIIGICNVVAVLAGGVLADGPGFATAYALLAAICIAGGIVLLGLARRNRGRPPATPTASA